MSGTKIKTLLKNLKTQNETTLETFQELPLTIQDDSSTTPVNLKLSLTENSVDIRPVGGTIGIGVTASTISLGNSTSVVGSTLSATNFTVSGPLNLDNVAIGTLSVGNIEHSSDITLSPGPDSLVKIVKEADTGTAAGLLIRKPSQGSAVITMGEGHSSDAHDLTDGFRLVYQGDGVTGETQGLDYNDNGAIQALDITSVTNSGVTTYTQNVHNILEWSRSGENVRLTSEDEVIVKAVDYVRLDVVNPTLGSANGTQSKLPLVNAAVQGTEHNNHTGSRTDIRSFRDIRMTVGMGYNTDANLTNENQSIPKISICKPSFTGLGVNTEVEVASIDHTGKAAFSEVTSPKLNGDVEVSGSLTAFNLLPRTDAGLRLGDDSTSDIVMSGDKVTISGTTQLLINGYIHPGVGTNRILRIKRDDLTPSTGLAAAVNNTPLGVSIEKPTDGSCFLQVVERYINGSTDTVHGCRLSSEGDATNEDLGLGNNYSGLQAIDGATVNNILSFYREGTDVKLKSQDNLYLEAPDIHIGSASALRITRTAVSSFVNGFLVYTTPAYVLGQSSGDTAVKKYAASTLTGNFTGSHTYPCTSPSFTAGSAVTLVNGQAVLCTSPSSKSCLGIVIYVLPTEDINRSSLGEFTSESKPDYIVKVAAVGDSRHENCQGFNVCNENGDIQPGDLLVTSNTAGYLMKQDDDIIRSCTVGKAMETVTFDESGQATGVYGYLYCG